MASIYIELTDAEIDLLINTAIDRKEYKFERFMFDKGRDKRTIGIPMEVGGLMGKFAVCKYFGLPTNSILEHHRGRLDGKNDAIILGKKTTKVKYTPSRKEGVWLFFNDQWPLVEDLAILATASEQSNVIRLAGWIDKKTFSHLKQQFPYGTHGDEYGLQEYELFDLEELQNKYQKYLSVK